MSFIFIYNSCYGGFGLSEEFIKIFNERHNEEYTDLDFKRDDPRVIELIQELGKKRSQSQYSKIKALSFPVKYKGFIKIHEYDGMERLYIDFNSYFIENLLQLSPSDTEAIAKLQEEIRGMKGNYPQGEEVELTE